MNHLNYHFNPKNITLIPFLVFTSAVHAVQIHSIMRKFAFNQLLKLMEGNLHYTGKVAGFFHHMGIVKSINYLDHQLQAKLYQGFD